MTFFQIVCKCFQYAFKVSVSFTLSDQCCTQSANSHVVLCEIPYKSALKRDMYLLQYHKQAQQMTILCHDLGGAPGYNNNSEKT